MKYVFLALLVFFSAFHLSSSYKDDAPSRAKTKPFLLIFILLYYLASVNAEPNMLLVWALATSWLGDVLLIPKGNMWFSLGGISFAASHILFILVYAANIDITTFSFIPVVPIAVVYYGLAFIVIFKVRPTTPKRMVVPMYIYLLANATMNIFSLMQLFTNPCPATAVAYMGAVLFFISDSTLFFVRYYKKPEIVFKKHFTVMFTYIVGELMITQGVMMLEAMT